MQDMRRVVVERLPGIATCAEELASMQCAALSSLGALLTAYTHLQPPTANLSQPGTQGAMKTLKMVMRFTHVMLTSFAANWLGAHAQIKWLLCTSIAESGTI